MIEAMMSVSMTGKMFGWSKWGGANQGMFTLLPSDEWFCQACGERQTKNLPSYMIPIDIFNRDFVKVCVECRHIFIIEKLRTFFKLVHRLKTPKLGLI